MNANVEKLVEMDIAYMNGSIQQLNLLKKEYANNPEVSKVIDNLIDVRKTGLAETLKGYTSFELSHLCHIESCKVISPEEAKTALAILKGSTQ